MTTLAAVTEEVTEAGVKVIVDAKNKAQSLYCTECCNTFKQQEDGTWNSYGTKFAEQVNDTIIQCSCGQNIGFIVPDVALPGEILAVN